MGDLTTILVLLGIAIVVVTTIAVAANRPRRHARNGASESTDIPAPIDLDAIADKLESPFEKMAHPGDIRDNAEFKRAVAVLSSDKYSNEQVRNYALGSNWVLQCIGFEALRHRDGSAEILERARLRIAKAWAWPLYFIVGFIDDKSQQPEIGNILSGAQYWWRDNAMICEEFGAIFRRRVDAGEEIDLGGAYVALESDDRANVRGFAAALPDGVRQPVEAAIDRFSRNVVDQRFLRSVGELVGEDRLREPVFETQQISQLLEELIDEIDGSRPRSILVVGDSGVGKSAIRRLFARNLLATGWRVFKTSAANIVADKKYVGEIEGQIRRLVQNATVAKRIAVFVDRLTELDEFGRTTGKDNSLLDQLWPAIEGQEMFFVSETTPAGLQALLKRFPTLPTTFKVVKMNPASESDTAKIAGSLLESFGSDVTPVRKDEVIGEALQLSLQYFVHKALPGSVLSLIKLAVSRSQRSDDDAPLGRTHVLDALSQVSGLPKDVLDERQRLDLEAVRGAFSRRIIGQDDAVECLVERIAMLKAGLTDPSRPVGVFLFAGPTGTGKTEIAKTLAELLFGSAEQMIRLDMSEYQNSDSAWRLIGDEERRGGSGSLATRIRERPFSVVLLDEFEKAHARVWDMFLQVFDDGRLTDTKGRLADFRHSIIILTSNLGSTIKSEAGIGFTSTRGEFSADDVMRKVNRTFRREFVNRLDRVVVFNPLGRDVMGAILQKELRLALGRRGLRTKQWAVEWEDSAIEFLLDEGFTPDLGARPLRRAIEKHLLAPLSMTMVQNEAPAGEQFLFVRSNGEALQVEFIDPDADDLGEPGDEEETVASDLAIEAILCSNTVPKGSSAALTEAMLAIERRIANDEWVNDKSELIAKMNAPEFWESDDRFAVLDRIELVDRIDSAASVLGALAGRLDRTSGNTRLVKGIANRIFVVREGLRDLDDHRPTQAVIGVRLVSADEGLSGAAAFRDNLVQMYRNWARARGMRLKELDASAGRYDALFLVSGFGSFGLLDTESGLHVFEIPANESKFDRIRARVEVAPLPTTGRQYSQAAREDAADLLDADKTRKVVIVRRYRQAPSPLARDSVRGWRTGRLDFVYEGNFDVIL